MNYLEYLKSEHWSLVRKRFFRSKLVSRNSSGKLCCEGCGKSDIKLSVHHRTYKRLGRERLIDLALVCDDCHTLIHTSYKSNLWKTTTKVLRKRRFEHGGRKGHAHKAWLPKRGGLKAQ